MLSPTIARTLSTCLGLLLLLAPAAPSAPVPQGDGLTVEAYCRLTQTLLELSVNEWTERVDLAAAHKSDRKKLHTHLEAAAKRYRPLREEAYSRHGLSFAADLRYASEHQSEIESYLDENPEVRDTLNSLRERVNTLIEQFESAPAPPSQGAQK